MDVDELQGAGEARDLVGEAILLVTPREQGRLRRIEYGTRHPIEPMDPPSNRVINKRRVAKFHQRIADALAAVCIVTAIACALLPRHGPAR